MIPINNNLVFKPENFNTSAESGITIILRNQEFLTSKTSEILLFEEDDLKWTEMSFSNKHFLGYLNQRPCYVSVLDDSSRPSDEMMLSPLRNLLGRIPDSLDSERYPHVIGRKPIGNISIANSDSGGSAYVDAAIVQADRAVNELL